MKIDGMNFYDWKHNPVTKNFMRSVKKMAIACKRALLSEELIMKQDGRELARILGKIEILEDIYNIKFDDVEE